MMIKSAEMSKSLMTAKIFYPRPSQIRSSLFLLIRDAYEEEIDDERDEGGFVPSTGFDRDDRVGTYVQLRDELDP